MTQAEKYVSLCKRGWTSWGDALRSGKCGNAPWKRWAEWKAANEGYILEDYDQEFGRWFVYSNGKRYREQVREREVKVNGARRMIVERRLVRVP